MSGNDSFHTLNRNTVCVEKSQTPLVLPFLDNSNTILYWKLFELYCNVGFLCPPVRIIGRFFLSFLSLQFDCKIVKHDVINLVRGYFTTPEH